KVAGLKDGDRIVSVGGTATPTYDDLVTAIRTAPAGPVSVGYERDGRTNTVTVTLVSALRHAIDDTTGTGKQTKASALGVSNKLPPGVPTIVTYGAVDGIGQAWDYTGQTFLGVGQALKHFPEKIPALWNALSGKPRDPNSPISVVGASRLGGESIQY